MQIIATAFANGSTNDFRLFKESKTIMAYQVLCLADAGYQGLADLHTNSQTPNKKSKHHPLTVEQKTGNRDLARQRIFVEHVIRKVKILAHVRDK